MNKCTSLRTVCRRKNESSRFCFYALEYISEVVNVNETPPAEKYLKVECVNKILTVAPKTFLVSSDGALTGRLEETRESH